MRILGVKYWSKFALTETNGESQGPPGAVEPMKLMIMICLTKAILMGNYARAITTDTFLYALFSSRVTEQFSAVQSIYRSTDNRLVRTANIH
jgi:hypothetical protein